MEYEIEIVIKDACILFDLVDLNLLEDFFKLGIHAFTTPQVIAEITREEQYTEISKHITNGNLQLDDTGAIEAILEIYNEYPGLSITDSSILELAMRKGAAVCSSDGSLRKISEKKKLAVRGILWIINELCVQQICTKELAIEKLNLYFTLNTRAPKQEIEKLINLLKNKENE